MRFFSVCGLVKIVEQICDLVYCTYASVQFYVTFKNLRLPEIDCIRIGLY